MNMIDACKQELEAERERVQVKLAEFEEPPEKSLTADVHITHANRPNEDVWDLLRYC